MCYNYLFEEFAMFALGAAVIVLFVNEIRKEYKRTKESNRYIADCLSKEFEKNENQTA
jgi:hypothetical protein